MLRHVGIFFNIRNGKVITIYRNNNTMIHLEPFLAREQTSSLNIKLSQPETDGSRLIQISARCLFGTDVSLSLSFRLRFFHFCECRCSVKNELLDLFSVFIIKLILKCNNNNLDLKKNHIVLPIKALHGKYFNIETICKI